MDNSPLPSQKYCYGDGTVSVFLGTVTAFYVLTVDFDYLTAHDAFRCLVV